VIGSSLAIPLTAIDEVDGDDEVNEDDGDYNIQVVSNLDTKFGYLICMLVMM
jgi:hypothetical protein